MGVQCFLEGGATLHAAAISVSRPNFSDRVESGSRGADHNHAEGVDMYSSLYQAFP